MNRSDDVVWLVLTRFCIPLFIGVGTSAVFGHSVASLIFALAVLVVWQFILRTIEGGDR